MKRIRQIGRMFGWAANRERLIKKNIKSLLASLAQYKTGASINTLAAQRDIREKFWHFLEDCGFFMALSDFQDILKQTEGKSREDGTVPWYHQLTPILMVLSLIESGELDLSLLEEYGGLEVLIRTHLHHDTIEDTGIDAEVFSKQQQEKIKDVRQEFRELETAKTVIVVNNVSLMSKKTAILDEKGDPQKHPDGRIVKKDLFENTRAYVKNMLFSVFASPVVWCLKLGDGIQNLSSMIGAAKFTVARRKKYCNEREDMFGARQGKTDIAIRKWPKFAKVIGKFDDLMGAVLYLNFGFLEYVDLAYPDDPDKYKEGQAIDVLGFDRYLANALSFKVPRAFSSFHETLDRMRHVSEHDPDLAKRARAKAYLQEAVYPVLEPYKEHFPEIFSEETILANAQATQEKLPERNPPHI